MLDPHHVRFDTQWAYKNNKIDQAQYEALRSIDQSLNAVTREISALRQTQAAGLALQAAVLARDILQDALEEFIFRAERMLSEFSLADSKYPVEIQFFQLRRFIEQVDQQEISTSCIRGRENKAAFEECLTNAKRMYRNLARNPGVREALEEEEAEQQKINSEQQKAEQAAQAQHRQDESSRLSIRLKELELAGVQGPLNFGSWYQYKFGNLPGIVQAPLWVFYGFLWIPIAYFMSSANLVQEINRKRLAEIASIKERLRELRQPVKSASDRPRTTTPEGDFKNIFGK